MILFDHCYFCMFRCIVKSPLYSLPSLWCPCARRCPARTSEHSPRHGRPRSRRMWTRATSRGNRSQIPTGNPSRWISRHNQHSTIIPAREAFSSLNMLFYKWHSSACFSPSFRTCWTELRALIEVWRLKFDAPLRSLSCASSLKNEGRREREGAQKSCQKQCTLLRCRWGWRARARARTYGLRPRGGGCESSFLNVC